jgi:basic membrane lipoprotein Med (substrate-binding protein (PBP1-ABC) superfamily)/ABC-type branched-subunit amino acid transport system substrate-binding protein
MKTRKASLAWSVLTIVTLLSFVLAACGPTPAPTKAPPPTEVPTAAPTEALAEGAPYKIGFCAAITGPGSSLGVPERNTAEMIAGQLEEEGGVVGPDGVQHAVEVIIYDTESNPDAAASVASRLITEDEVDVLVCGTLSGSSMAIMPLAAENEVPYISMASARAIIQDPETKESRKWAFKTPQENLHSGEWQALYLEAMGITTICDLYENTGYGQDCLANTKAAVEAKGIEVVYEDTFERSDTEFPQMAGVTGSGCEAVVVGAIPPGASMVTVAARDTDPDLPVIQGHGVCNTAFIELAGDAAEETVFPCGKLMIADLLPDDDPQRAMLQKYIEDYTEFTDGEPIDTFGGHALDALLWAEEGLASLEEGLSLAERRAAIRDYIEGNIKDWPGTGGVFNITPDDHLGLAYDALTFVKVENGTWVHFPPEQWGAPPVVAAVDFTAGMVSDVGGIDDASFNENTWKGFLDAQDYLGIKVTFLESQAQADYENNITEFAEQGYDMIITVGFLLGDATYKMAKQYPDVKFAIVDYPSGGEETPNLQGILFNVHEASFPVGYVAAAMADQLDPDDPIVAHVSGMQIPPVEEFIVAYEHGVKYYNEKYDKDVKFTGVYVGDFEAPDQGKLQGNSLIDEGADIIMGVGGKTGNGGITAAKERGKWGIGVDVDQYYTLPNERDILVTSTIKRLDKAVFSVVKSAVEGTFEGGTNYIATLENEGVGVGPFHDFEDKVPDNIKADLEEIQRAIIAGELETGWPPE